MLKFIKQRHQFNIAKMLHVLIKESRDPLFQVEKTNSKEKINKQNK